MKKNISFAVNTQKLHSKVHSLTFSTQERLSNTEINSIIQPRATRALELALAMPSLEFSIFVAAEPGIGRTHFLQDFFCERSKLLQTPPDLIYVYNFESPEQPKILQLEPGQGHKFKIEMNKIITKLRTDIVSKLEHEKFVDQKNILIQETNSIKDAIFDQMTLIASKEGFSIRTDDAGAISLNPLHDGKIVNQEDFETLSTEERQEIKDRSAIVMNSIVNLSRKIEKEDKALLDKEDKLEQKLAKTIIDNAFKALIQSFGSNKQLKQYLKELCADILKQLDIFKQKKQKPNQDEIPETFFNRYAINLFVNNKNTIGAPVIFETNPDFFTLLGCIERESELGSFYTDFTLVKSGSLHRANGGYLIIHINELLRNPAAWDGLLLCLSAKQGIIQDMGMNHDMPKTKTITPEPISLNLKVIIIGDDEMYELLYATDDRFNKFFKIKAHLQSTVDRNMQTMQAYANTLQNIREKADATRLSKVAIAALIDYSSRLAEDQEKLALTFPAMREIIIEANAIAIGKEEKIITDITIEEALRGRRYRSNSYEEEFYNSYDRELIKVQTEGSAIARCNGLSITQINDYMMGLPHQIACAVGVGDGGILDLEREAELGGPIHTKGMMILKSYLLETFAQDKPLTFTGSIYFEQSYAHVDGDSASGAELVALLSALSETPIRLDLAFTGAISQNGSILAVGGVTHKIEGFYEICRRRGFTGTQGVIIPKCNVEHLLLKKHVIESVKNGEFHIYAVEHIENALALLTGKNIGQKNKNYNFTKGSVLDLVNMRLKQLAKLTEKSNN